MRRTPSTSILFFFKSHHAGQCEQRRLDLGHVTALKQVVGFEDIVRFQAVRCDGLDEVRQVLQLKPHQIKQRSMIVLLQDVT